MIPLSPLPPPPSYRVPWRVRRDDPRHPSVWNSGSEVAEFVRVYRDDRPSEADSGLYGHIAPGEQFEVCLCGADLDAVIVTVLWFRPSDGWEYLWRFVM